MDLEQLRQIVTENEPVIIAILYERITAEHGQAAAQVTAAQNKIDAIAARMATLKAQIAALTAHIPVSTT